MCKQKFKNRLLSNGNSAFPGNTDPAALQSLLGSYMYGLFHRLFIKGRDLIFDFIFVLQTVELFFVFFFISIYKQELIYNMNNN